MPLIPSQNPLSLPDLSEAVTQAQGDSSTKLATTAFVQNELINTATITKNATGFENSADVALSVVDATRVFTIQPVSTSFTYYQNGVKYVVSSAKTVTLPNTEGFYYIYLNGTTLTYLSAFDVSLIKEYVFVSEVYYDATNAKFLFLTDELHGLIMDPATHLYLHKTIGTDYRSGFSLLNFSVDGDGSSNAHAQFTVSSGSFADEDLDFDYTSTAQIPIFYKVGSEAGSWRRKDADTFPVIYDGTAGYTGGTIPYNRFDAGVWSLTAASEGHYVLVHVFAFNDRTQKIFGVQGINQYQNLNAARLGAETEILSLNALPTQESTPLGTVIFLTNSSYTNTPSAAIQSVDAAGNFYLDFRQITTFNFNGAVGAVSSHSLLADLDQDDHLQYFNTTRGDARYQLLDTDLTAIAGLTSTGIVTRTGVGTATTRTLTGTASRITVTNGDGVAGNPSIDIDSNYVGQTSITTLGTISAGTWQGTTIAADRGGTGQSSFAIGDILFADTTNSLAKLADVATGNVLLSGGVGVAPAYGKVGLSTHVSGTLAIANGGTGQTTQTSAFNALSPLTTKGDLIAHNGTNNVRVSVGANGLVLTADSTTAEGVKWAAGPAATSIENSNVNAAGNTTTTSTTDTLLNGMTITPGAGTYVVMFYTDSTQSTNTGTNFFSVYANGSKVANSEIRQINGGPQYPAAKFPVAITGVIVTVAAAQAIQIRWRVSAGTGTAGNRQLTLIKVG